MTTWITRRPDAQVDAELATVDPSLPLAGTRLAVKDNIDVAGLPTTAACPAFAYEPDADATVVQRLMGAGAVVVGKTNLDQFATGLVGTRSPYGPCESPVAPGRVSGGSSSGSAVAVATGEADLALGTDTAGSGRVPAALCGVVGLKPTPGWLPSTGVVPACASYDCVSVFARDVAGAALALALAAGFDDGDPRSRRRPGVSSGPVRRLGVPASDLLARTCEAPVAEAFADLVARLPELGVDAVTVDLDAYLAAGALLYGGTLVAERYAAVGAFVAAHRQEVDPTVGGIVAAAGELPAHALAADQQALAVLRRRADRVWEAVDAVLVPTVPGHPTLDEVAADPVGVNAGLGTFTTGTNLVGWCGAAVPVGRRADGLPFGVTVLGPGWSDPVVWAAAAALAEPSAVGAADVLAAAVERALVDAGPAGGPGGQPRSPQVEVAVCGAHLRGEPLNHQLTDRGGRLVRTATTTPSYRMVRLATEPPKPGLVRVADGGGAVEVEVWRLGVEAFGALVAEVPPPLAIGTVELADGTTPKGFVCEAHAAEGAEDITVHGGWRAAQAAGGGRSVPSIDNGAEATGSV